LLISSILSKIPALRALISSCCDITSKPFSLIRL
ncbi:hypothetical protein MGS_04599, partial [Candida albicans P78042]